ncbi:MAG TPA: hypothetical protein P5165_02800 [Spirochaetia bacterium]|nr:hypothetical protein [Spirochaetia bacterium]
MGKPQFWPRWEYMSGGAPAAKPRRKTRLLAQTSAESSLMRMGMSPMSSTPASRRAAAAAANCPSARHWSQARKRVPAASEGSSQSASTSAGSGSRRSVHSHQGFPS